MIVNWGELVVRNNKGLNNQQYGYEINSRHNNKYKQMSDEDSQHVLNMSLHRRRFSLFEKNHLNIENNHREVIKNKYKQFIKSKRISLPDYSDSSQAISFSRAAESTGRSMPSIRLIREQNHLIGESLRKTISRYNYVNHEKQKKLQALNRKKQKYDHILKVREEHSQLKKKLNQSLVSLNRQISQEKIKLKQSVGLNRIMANQSRVQLENRKKSMGRERRQEIFQSKSKIKENKASQYQICKKLHEAILSEEKGLKIKKNMLLQDTKKKGMACFYEKLKSQVKKFVEIQKVETTTRFELSSRVSDLEKSNRIIDQKLKNYQSFLKDGSTLKKDKIHIKIKKLQDGKQKNQAGIQVAQGEQQEQSFY